MALQVIGEGFGRRGTKSMQTALLHLGYNKCHHMSEVFPSSKQIAFWHAASLGEAVDWDAVFEGYTAAVDWPSAAYWKELAEHYPDAKIVLTVRDPEAWYTSVSETIYQVADAMPKWLCAIRKPFWQIRDMVRRTVWTGVFDDRFEDKDHAIRVFTEHIEDVKRTIPADRLLVHQAKEGWEPLCEFLGEAVPDITYPRVNEASEIKRMVKIMRWVDKAPWALAAIAFIIGALSILG